MSSCLAGHSSESKLVVIVSVLALTGTRACSRSSGTTATRVAWVSFTLSSDGLACYWGFALPSYFVK